MPDHLIAATDGSDCGNRAVALGLAMAERYDADVDVIHVRDGTADAAGDERAARLLEDAVAPARESSLAVETHVLPGRPAEGITGFAADRGADLLVLGRRGRSGLAAHLLGSVTERVLRTATVPVLTVPEGDAAPGLDRVLLTTDGSDAAMEAVATAADLARRSSASLHVLSAVDVQGEAGFVDAGGVDEAFVERLESRARATVERVADSTENAAVETAVVRGSPHEAVSRYVAGNGIDLVVLASEGQTNLAGQRLGSVAGRLLRSLDVPVLVVPVRD